MPISWGDIDAFARLTRADFAPWEVRIITALDDVWLGSMHPASNEPSDPSA